MRRSWLVVGGIVGALACAAEGQVTPAAGFMTAFSSGAGGTGLAFVPGGGGDWLTISSTSVVRFSPGGQAVGTVGSGLDPAGFGSFVAADGGGVYAAAGQTLAGPGFPGSVHVFRLDGSASGAFDLAGNFDAVFDPVSGMLFLSALNGLAGNALWAVQPDPTNLDFGTLVQVGSIGGNSGPVAFDGQGNLFVGTSGVDLDGNGVGFLDAGIAAFNAARVAEALASPGSAGLSSQVWSVVLADAAFQNVADLATDSDGDLLYHDFTNLLQLPIEVIGTGLSAVISAGPAIGVGSGPFFGLGAMDFLASPPGSFEPGPGQGLGGTAGVLFDSNADWITDSMIGITPVPDPPSVVLLLAAGAAAARRRGRRA